MNIAHRFHTRSRAGFALAELAVSMAIFLAICGAMFLLLNSSQKHYDTQTKLLGSFQDARLGVDEIVRDAENSGYPPQNQFALGVNALAASAYTNSPVAWSPNYPTTACLIGTAGGGTCTTPGDFDAIFEEATDTTGIVKWIRYQLVGTTLFRGVVTKVAGDPSGPTTAAGVLLPYVTNVVNNVSAAQRAQYVADYPNMFPGGVAQPVFQYYCDGAANTAPVLCQNAGAYNSPVNVRDIEINLIVLASQNDQQTQKPRLVQLQGRGHRVNPNQ
ncbi:MAG TPA: hypothetical protein VN661_09255 [Candidatus Acidoferrales bacterium]|nr:hypothetical protein [Candidatus Acidoferrales bacterium]